jgi:hypothetical protein
MQKVSKFQSFTSIFDVGMLSRRNGQNRRSDDIRREWTLLGGRIASDAMDDAEFREHEIDYGDLSSRGRSINNQRITNEQPTNNQRTTND